MPYMQGLAPKHTHAIQQYRGKTTRQAVAKRLRHSVEISPFPPKTLFPDRKRSCNAPPPHFNVNTL